MNHVEIAYEEWKKNVGCWWPSCRACPSDLVDCTPEIHAESMKWQRRVHEALEREHEAKRNQLDLFSEQNSDTIKTNTNDNIQESQRIS